MFRLLFITFTGSFRGTEEQETSLARKPCGDDDPFVILAILSIIGGFVGVPEVFMNGGDKLAEFLSPVSRTNMEKLSFSTEFCLMALSTVISCCCHCSCLAPFS